MTTYFDEPFTGGTNGGTVTAAPGNTAFDQINGTAPTFTNDSAIPGALSMRINISTAAQSSGRGQLGASRSVVYINYPLKANAAWATGNWFPHEARATTTIRADCRFPSGVPTIRNGTTAVWTSGVTLSVGVQYWVEHKIDNGSSKQSLTIWDAAGNVVVASGDQTYNQGTVDNILVGNCTSVANVDVTIGRVRVASTSLGLTIRIIPIGQASEADTAQPVRPVRARTVSQASETDTAQPAVAQRRHAIGQAVETDAAQPVRPVRIKGIGQAVESDTGQSVTAAKARLIGQAVETDTATTVGRQKTLRIGQAAEVDTAQPVGRRKTFTIGQATETDTAGPVRPAKARLVGLAVETDSALPVHAVKAVRLGQAAETDTAQAVAAAHVVLIGQATETDTAQPVTARVGYIAGPVDIRRGPGAGITRSPDPATVGRAPGATVRRTV